VAAIDRSVNWLVANSFVERVRGPESPGIEMFKSIRDDVLDCGGGLTLPRWDGAQWHVTSMFDHEHRPSPEAIKPKKAPSQCCL
jgi:hypothetical protein